MTEEKAEYEAGEQDYPGQASLKRWEKAYASREKTMGCFRESLDKNRKLYELLSEEEDKV